MSDPVAASGVSTAPAVDALPAPGWYADPVDPAGRRWWSGLAWTEHIEAPAEESLGEAGPVPTTEPEADDESPVITRAAVRSASADQALADALAARSGRNDPYRDRQLLPKAALVIALLSVVGVGARLVMEVPILLQFVIGGVPISVAGLALYLAFRSGSPMRIPLIAALLSVATAAASTALDASTMGDLTGGLTGLTGLL